MGRAGSPIYKGEPGDYDLPFVRSFQLFCPIKISIFSPIAATLAGSPFAVSLTRPPPAALSTQATLHTVTSTVPNPVILPLLTLAHPVIQPPLSLHRFFFPSLSLRCCFSLSLLVFFRSLISFNLSSLFFSLSVSTYAIPTSIFNYWLRERSWTTRKKRETKSLTVSACTQTGACFTALLRLPSDYAIKRREIERMGKGESGGRVRRRASWQKSETNEQRSVRRGFPCKCDRTPGSRNRYGTRCDTQCFKEPNRVGGT